MTGYLTLKEMAQVYRANNALLRARMSELRTALRTSRDDAEREQLKQRVSVLNTIYREGRETAVYMERYYVGRRRRHGQTSPHPAGQ